MKELRMPIRLDGNRISSIRARPSADGRGSHPPPQEVSASISCCFVFDE